MYQGLDGVFASTAYGWYQLAVLPLKKILQLIFFHQR